MQRTKPYLRYILGGICLILGIALMFIPFIPMGYLLIGAAILILAPKVPFLKKQLSKLKKRDKKGHLERLEHKIEEWENGTATPEGNKNK